MGRHAMIAVPSPVNLCALTIIPPASLYMTLAHEYAVKCLKGAQSRTQTPNPKPKPQSRTRTRTQTQTRSPNRSPNRPHRIGSALGMGAEGSSAGGKGGMNPSKGEGSIPRCSLYLSLRCRTQSWGVVRCGGRHVPVPGPPCLPGRPLLILSSWGFCIHVSHST